MMGFIVTLPTLTESGIIKVIGGNSYSFSSENITFGREFMAEGAVVLLDTNVHNQAVNIRFLH